ncbi:MAG TPA: hypothetical protein VLF40_00890 [Candidatus Saccharimonadales bacterium]|nr:hypothetical protein [Candidatus Saccharimonadales bacterium]
MKQWFQVTFLVLVLAATGTLVVERQAAVDWWHLRGYTAPANVVQLATDDTMTGQARHLFYVNHPDVTTGKAFTSNCPAGREKTVVLGCYLGNDHGIYVYAVDDQRLNGVEQVTAAHEMLHAAYRRLSGSERKRVDAMLLDYYQHDLADQRIKDTIEAYKTSEPDDVVNEMHSIFGTEVAGLPAGLEQYYAQYFTDRSKVTGYTASYQGEFTTRKDQVAAFDTQLKAMKQEIAANEASLKQQKAALDARRAQLDAERSAGAPGYYADAVAFNKAVDAYNSQVAQNKNLIDQYNDIVDQRNAVVLEEQELSQELSASAISE